MWGEGGGSPHINTKMKKLSIDYNNVWPALRFQINLLEKNNCEFSVTTGVFRFVDHHMSLELRVKVLPGEL
jgi:hypothetical protein